MLFAREPEYSPTFKKNQSPLCARHFSPQVALLRRVQRVRVVFSVILERQCVWEGRSRFAAYAAAAAPGPNDCFIRKTCGRRFAGSPTPTAASPFSSKSQHCRGTGFSNDHPPGVSPGGRVEPSRRRPHLAVGVNRAQAIGELGVRVEPRRRRQQSSLVSDLGQARVRSAQCVP